MGGMFVWNGLVLSHNDVHWHITYHSHITVRQRRWRTAVSHLQTWRTPKQTNMARPSLVFYNHHTLTQVYTQIDMGMMKSVPENRDFQLYISHFIHTNYMTWMYLCNLIYIKLCVIYVNWFQLRGVRNQVVGSQTWSNVKYIPTDGSQYEWYWFA